MLVIAVTTTPKPAHPHAARLMRLTSLLVAVLWMRAAALVLYRSPSLRRGMASATKRPLTAMLDDDGAAAAATDASAPSPRPVVLVIAGPTGIGKSSLALALCDPRADGEDDGAAAPPRALPPKPSRIRSVPIARWPPSIWCNWSMI